MPRAMLAASGVNIASSAPRSSTVTLENSTETPGAATDRRSRSGTADGCAGEPGKFFTSSAWIRSARRWLDSVKFSCARSHEIKYEAGCVGAVEMEALAVWLSDGATGGANR